VTRVANAQSMRLLYFLRAAAASGRLTQKMSYVLSGIAIVICGGIGAAIAWMIVSSIGWDGVTGALVATAIGMVLATALFVLGVFLAKTLGYFK
jgi:hypothetical protein